MSSISESTQKGTLLEWVKNSGVLAVTLIGLFLYAFLSVPAIVFYNQFGVRPSEVGITYASLLGGSTAEVMMLILSLTIAFLVLAFFAVITSFEYRIIRVAGSLVRTGRKVPWDAPDEKFEQYISIYRNMFTRLPEIIEVLKQKSSYDLDDDERAIRRSRELRRLGVLTEDQTAEHQAILSAAPLVVSPDTLVWISAKMWMRSHGKLLAAGFASVSLVALLPALAYFQAGEVLRGEQYVGSNIGVFGYSANPVKITSASAVAADSVKPFQGATYFLLGENSQYYVLYCPKNRSTIRVPVASVILVNLED